MEGCEIIFLLFIIVVVIVAKIVTFHLTSDLMGSNMLLLALASAGSILLLMAFIRLLSTKWATIIMMVLLNLIISLLLFADIVYNKYFLGVIPKEALLQTGEAQGVGESIKELISWKDFLFFVDIPVFIFLSIMFRNSLKMIPWKKRLQQAGVILVSGLILFGVSYQMLSDQLTSDRGSFINLGVINYHLYDFLISSEAQQKPPVPEKGEESLADQLARQIAEYRSTIPVTEMKKLQGVAKGKNLLVIQLESFQTVLMNLKVDGQEITPNLNKLIKESIYFDNFYQENGIGNTADSEFITNNSLFPTTGAAVYKRHTNNDFITLPSILKEQGYETFAFHGYDHTFYDRHLNYPKQGIDTFYNPTNLNNDEIVGMGISDSSIYKQMIPILKDAQPFYSLFVTLSSHHPYWVPATGLTLEKGLKENIVGSYLNSARYTDNAVGELMELLKQNEMLDNTVIVLYGDHRAITLDDKEWMEKILNIEEYSYLDMFKVPLIIRLPQGEGAGTYSIIGGHLDTFPTLANLMDIELPNHVLGRDLINSKEGFVAYRMYLPERSFINEKYFLQMPKNYNFKEATCFDRISREKVPLSQCQTGYDQAKNLFKITDDIFKYNIIPDIDKKK